MSRYYLLPQRAARANFDWLEERPLLHPLTVYEPESPHVPSGLYDHDGHELYRSSRMPIGFIYPKDTA